MTTDQTLAAVVIAGLNMDLIAKHGVLEIAPFGLYNDGKTTAKWTVASNTSGVDMARLVRNALNRLGIPHEFDINFERGAIGFRYTCRKGSVIAVEGALFIPFFKSDHVVQFVEVPTADVIKILNEMACYAERALVENLEIASRLKFEEA